MLYDRGFALHDVADVLGHRDVSVTQRIYVQAREGTAQRLASMA
jgi:integrase